MPSSIVVVVERGRLTVNVHDAPLDEVLQAVGDQAGVAIKLHGDLAAPVTKFFADLPLEDGIRRLLRGYSYTLSAGDGDPDRSIEISVIAPYRAEQAATVPKTPAPDDARAKRQRIRELLRRNDAAAIAELSGIAEGDPSPGVRSQAVAALGRLKNEGALAPLTLALADQSSAVRIQALRGIRNLKGTEAIGDLQTIVSYDPDPALRREAVRLLSQMQSPGVPWLLRQAATDSDAAVSKEAKRALTRWERRFGPQTGMPGRAR